MDAFNVVSLFGDGFGPAKFLLYMLGVIAFGIWRGVKE